MRLTNFEIRTVWQSNKATKALLTFGKKPTDWNLCCKKSTIWWIAFHFPKLEARWQVLVCNCAYRWSSKPLKEAVTKITPVQRSSSRNVFIYIKTLLYKLKKETFQREGMPKQTSLTLTAILFHYIQNGNSRIHVYLETKQNKTTQPPKDLMAVL